ncbi:MAG: hypothetical protein N3G21_11415, partial [Candidatus Hydrogenedentes bacterium]|nr:hypothetical protein [Candidatus Hydrogenedentota bacterium]
AEWCDLDDYRAGCVERNAESGYGHYNYSDQCRDLSRGLINIECSSYRWNGYQILSLVKKRSRGYGNFYSFISS